jgi:hypothetical protein
MASYLAMTARVRSARNTHLRHCAAARKQSSAFRADGFVPRHDGNKETLHNPQRRCAAARNNPALSVGRNTAFIQPPPKQKSYP